MKRLFLPGSAGVSPAFALTFDRLLCLKQAILAAASVVFAFKPAGRRRSQEEKSILEATYFLPFF
jgi:hypothetical protein